MTGWNDIEILPEYRPNGSTILLTCKKDQECPVSYSKYKFGE